MEKYCIICNNEGKYKCPICLVYYCSVGCCRKHRETACDVVVKVPVESKSSQCDIGLKWISPDTIPMEKLMLLKDDPNLRNLLLNPHLIQFLLTLNGQLQKDNDKADEITQMAMQEPLFVEFVDACLNILDPARSNK